MRRVAALLVALAVIGSASSADAATRARKYVGLGYAYPGIYYPAYGWRPGNLYKPYYFRARSIYKPYYNQPIYRPLWPQSGIWSRW